MKDYIKPKYKIIMGKWFKETGGGAKTIANFGNYTMYKGMMYEWFTWIYVLDKDADNLLSFSTGAKHPNCFIAAESGFSDGNGDDDEAPTPTRRRTRVVIPGSPLLWHYQAFAGIPQEYRNSRRKKKLLKGKGKFGLNL